MSNPISSSPDWVHYYHRTLSGQGVGQAPSASVSDATVVTTTAPSVLASSSTSNISLNPEGRVTKPARRRRASRAAPTTLVNTDTTNFRAMVQQFTGVSNPTLTFGNEAKNIDFRTFQNHQRSPVPQGSGFRNPFQHPQQQQQQQQRVVQQQQGYMPQLQNRGDGLISSFSNIRPNVEASSDGFLGGNTSSSEMFPRSSSSSINNRNHGYIQ